jgi:aspartyl-tRNA(Asn)/glutamyl-tRNA(Gln) amidotransferase subunit B
METDTAKSIYQGDKVLIDYNRAGMPLLEIVTEAQNTHPVDAKLIVREMQELLQSLEISSAHIDQGQMRVDVNVSVEGEKMSSNRIEIKNVAGAKNVERAVEYEFRRHIELLQQGEVPAAETRRFDANEGKTITLRRKEQEPDYRFFQDPDLPQIFVTNDRISRMHGLLGEVPFEVKRRFTNQFGMDVSDVKNIFRNPWSIELFTRLIWTLQIDPKTVYNWLYEHIYGNCEKKELNFQHVVENQFGHKKLCNLLMLLHDN